MRRLWVLLALAFFGCGPRLHTVTTSFDPQTTPPVPDYSDSESWAALPAKRDAADSVPRKSDLEEAQASAIADVFFVYPTLYTDKPDAQHPWNADVHDAELNEEIQRTTILNQATVFNGSCRVYAPYYRQAHLDAFYSTRRADAQAALDLAYEDVRSAFLYYLNHFNQGRPIVIASHSQGSYHTMRLIRDFIDGKELQQQLVVAYLVGRAIPRDAFTTIQPMKNAEETGVWASWNTFGKGYLPETHATYYTNALSINPLLWSDGESFADRTLNKGGVGLKFTMVPQLADAQNHKNLLWIHRPYVPFRFLLRNKVWHRADINLFYGNIRENVAARIKAFAGQNQSN